MRSLDFINRGNAEYIETLYEQYLADPRSLDDESQAFFAGYELADGSPSASASVADADGASLITEPGQLTKGVYALVHAYREFGHFVANLDPLGNNRPDHPLLKLSEFGLSIDDLDRVVGKGDFLGPADGTLRNLTERLRETYCRTLGVEYMDIPDKNQRTWLQEQMEPILNHRLFSEAERRNMLYQLYEAEMLEQFLQTKYLGHKRFSLEGGEALIPMLHAISNQAADLGVEEVVIGMAHRGRINVLANFLRKPVETVFYEFEGAALSRNTEGDGDVKYHLGYSYDRITEQGRRFHLSVTYNPSHLELVDPVIEGIVRSKQEYKGDAQRKRVVPIQIHGDASFTGQGIVAETLNLSELKGYHTGGTIHIIINNHLGFTATPDETRFTPYATDIAKTIKAPVFHVNADDPEAVVHAAKMAMAFRNQFKADVILDLWCYRKYGHNEADDPTFTQPLLYAQIQKHPSATEIYRERLLDQGVLTEEDVEGIKTEIRSKLDHALEAVRANEVPPPSIKPVSMDGLWYGFTKAGKDWTADTAVRRDIIETIAEKTSRIPPGFSLHPKLKRLYESRNGMAAGEQPIDWGCAEMWAFGSLVLEGIPIRLDGQDSQRGTFSHRHAVWNDIKTGERYVPLMNLDKDQPYFVVYNTMLSELAVLGFVYGISCADPRRLVIWEAQFGDFSNGAQAIIDQFIVSSESKWQRMSGLVMLLPHGFEGQGPEHSSARLERYLSLCAEDNIQVANLTTPAQYFHILRRQMHRSFRKPLIIMSPKSLLRHKRAVSKLSDFTNDSFHNTIDDASVTKAGSVRRIILSTGKIYYDLLERKEQLGRDDAALLRIEQLYPFPAREIEMLLERYDNVEQVMWVQEEPQNMGAWSFIEPRIRPLLPKGYELQYVGRPEAASPAPGSLKTHQEKQEKIVRQALED